MTPPAHFSVLLSALPLNHNLPSNTSMIWKMGWHVWITGLLLFGVIAWGLYLCYKSWRISEDHKQALADLANAVNHRSKEQIMTMIGMFDSTSEMPLLAAFFAHLKIQYETTKIRSISEAVSVVEANMRSDRDFQIIRMIRSGLLIAGIGSTIFAMVVSMPHLTDAVHVITHGNSTEASEISDDRNEKYGDSSVNFFENIRQAYVPNLIAVFGMVLLVTGIGIVGFSRSSFLRELAIEGRKIAEYVWPGQQAQEVSGLAQSVERMSGVFGSLAEMTKFTKQAIAAVRGLTNRVEQITRKGGAIETALTSFESGAEKMHASYESSALRIHRATLAERKVNAKIVKDTVDTLVNLADAGKNLIMDVAESRKAFDEDLKNTTSRVSQWTTESQRISSQALGFVESGANTVKSVSEASQAVSLAIGTQTTAIEGLKENVDSALQTAQLSHQSLEKRMVEIADSITTSSTETVARLETAVSRVEQSHSATTSNLQVRLDTLGQAVNAFASGVDQRLAVAAEIHSASQKTAAELGAALSDHTRVVSQGAETTQALADSAARMEKSISDNLGPLQQSVTEFASFAQISIATSQELMRQSNNALASVTAAIESMAQQSQLLRETLTQTQAVLAETKETLAATLPNLDRLVSQGDKAVTDLTLSATCLAAASTTLESESKRISDTIEHVVPNLQKAASAVGQSVDRGVQHMEALATHMLDTTRSIAPAYTKMITPRLVVVATLVGAAAYAWSSGGLAQLLHWLMSK